MRCTVTNDASALMRWLSVSYSFMPRWYHERMLSGRLLLQRFMEQ